MKKLFEQHWKELLLISAYILVAIAVYVTWFHTLWHLWYVDCLTGLGIFVIGCAIGTYYIREMDKEKAKKEAEALEGKEEPKEEKIEETSNEEKGTPLEKNGGE